MALKTVKQEIKCGDKQKGLLRKSNFNKVELERLLTDLLSLTELSTYKLTCRLADCGENLKKAVNTEILVGLTNMRVSGVPVQICLAGHTEKWTIMVHLNKVGQANPEWFRSQILNASKTVNQMEAGGDETVMDVSNGSVPSPATVAPHADNEDGDGVTSPPPPSLPEQKGGPRRKTSSVITKEVIESLLRGWKKDFGKTMTIPQRKFRELLASVVETEISVPLVVAFLQKNGIIKLIPNKSRPEIELAQRGIVMLERLAGGQESGGHEMKPQETPASAPELLAKVPSVLQTAQALQDAIARLNLTRQARKEGEERLGALRREVVLEEKGLAECEEAEASIFREIEELLSSMGGVNLVALLLAAKETIDPS